MTGQNGGKRKQAVKNTREWRTEAGTERATTYERSSGVAGCDPLRLCAKLRFPVPAWRGAFWSPAPPMETPPPNAAHPEPLLAVMSVVSGSDQARAGPPPRSSYPSFRRLVSCSTPNARVVEVVGVVVGHRSPLAYHASFGVPLLVAVRLAPKFLSKARLRVCECANYDGSPKSGHDDPPQSDEGHPCRPRLFSDP